jgi:hypothetical protein
MTRYRFVFLLLSGFIPIAARAQNCSSILFLTQNDINNPCIVDYKGGTQLLAGTGGCDGWAFGMPTGTGYIVIGPIPTATKFSFDYYVYNNGQLRLEYGPAPSGPWTNIETFGPGKDQCLSHVTPVAIPAGNYFKMSQPPGTGNPGGPLKFFIRNITPIDLLPVELTSFQAARVGSRVKLTWKTASEVNNFGFEIERMQDGKSWARIGFVEGHGTSDVPRSYVWTDVNPVSSTGDIKYRLRQVDRDGTFEYSPVVSVSTGAASFGFRSAYPNPFNPSTTLSFVVDRDSYVTLKIFDQSGREVETLASGEQMPAGSYSRVFSSRSIPSGEFTAWLFTENQSSLQKLYLVK